MALATGSTGSKNVLRPTGLRARVIIAFAVGALLVSATFAASTYLLARSYLLDQRERSATRQAYRDAQLVRDQLSTAGARVPDALTAVDPPAGAAVVVRRGDRWFSSSLDVGRDAVPAALRTRVESGDPASLRVRVNGAPRLVIGLPLPAVNASFYELAPLDELESTLRVLGTVLAVGALVAAAGGATLGLWASRSVLRPLNHVAATAAQIAGGNLDTRVQVTADPDLATIVGSFNSMVDSLQQRIERDARFVGDVSHELRSPLTTLVTSVEVLGTRRSELPERSRRALDLVSAELERFRRVLDNLLELARSDAKIGREDRESLCLADLLRHSLADSGRSPELVAGDTHASVRGDKARLERTFVNLFDNADHYGGGLVEVTVRPEGDGQAGTVLVWFDDAGPGVPVSERDRIFDRFATGRTRRASSSGTGLGLALVSETVAAHGGAVWCTERPGGGARFVVSLPMEPS